MIIDDDNSALFKRCGGAKAVASTRDNIGYSRNVTRNVFVISNRPRDVGDDHSFNRATSKGNECMQ